MNKNLLLFVGLFSCTGLTLAQTTVTQPNGVVVHEAQGVEKPKKSQENTVSVRTIEEWTLNEILDAEPYFANKRLLASSEKDKRYYEDQWNALQKRKAELLNAEKQAPKTTN